MPATAVIVLERQSRLAAAVQSTIENLPARLCECRNAADVFAAFKANRSRVCLIDVETAADGLEPLLGRIEQECVWTAFFVDSPALDLKDRLNLAGAVTILPTRIDPVQLNLLVERLVEISQRAMRRAAGERTDTPGRGRTRH